MVSFNGTFKASIRTLSKSQSLPHKYHLCVVHADSSTVIWTANRGTPMSESSLLNLTADGLSITTEPNQVVWSATQLSSKVAALRLLDTGNLVLLDKNNVALWQSFDHPTDTLVLGQPLLLGKTLASSRSEDDATIGDYRLLVTESNAVMQWKGTSYWKLSMEIKAFKDSNSAVSFMVVNGTGLFLLARNGSTAVLKVRFAMSDFRILQVGFDGRLKINNLVDDNLVEEFSAPSDPCQVPFVCGRLGLCNTTGSLSKSCSCPSGLNAKASECVPNNRSLSLPLSFCNSTSNTSVVPHNSSVSYLELGHNVDYFANGFDDVAKSNLNLSACQDICSKNCSCLALFHESSSRSCHIIHDQLGSVMSDSSSNRLGYLKVLVPESSSPKNPIGNDLSSGDKRGFPIVALVLLPSSGLILVLGLALAVILWLRRGGLSRAAAAKTLWRWNSSSSAEVEEISIPGLPVRFEYEELVAATENFKTQIGSGGFGTVYKGTLPDQTVVAVKKMTSLGVRGKKEFYTEITIIGNIHHINLVRLKGFCAQGRQRFLVLEFMNRGSLDRALFCNSGQVLDWRERFEIALGTARGLAYLHNGCDQRIIHCDVKPENILLHDHSRVKISDFGLSKLLSPEESSLFTTMRGTRGYLAPEWLTSSSISDKADVYSYGMVLLEIVRGKKNSWVQTWSKNNSSSTGRGSGGSSLSPSPGGVEPQAVYFPMLALEMHEQRRYKELVDPRLEGRVADESEVEKMVKIALCCVQEDPALRPSMATVVGMLEGGMPVVEPRIQSLNFLRFYGRRFTEASHQNVNEEDDIHVMPNNSTGGGTGSSAGSYNSLSYISSHQLSGPR